MKKLLITLLKVALSLAILAYLLINAQRNAVFAQLWEQPKEWSLLLMGGGLCLCAVQVTFFRWRYLVRTLEIPFSVKEVQRVGFVGYLFNLAPVGGIVGGDLVKAVMLARMQRGCGTKIAASVVVDRIIGLYGLFLVASGAIATTGFGRIASPKLHSLCQATYWVTMIGTVCLAGTLLPMVTDGWLARSAARVPKIGRHIESLFDALRMYRSRMGVLILAIVMTIGVHLLFAMGVYCFARGLFSDALPLSMHCVIVPLSSAAGVLPLPAGPFEMVLDGLYTSVPLAGGGYLPSGPGTVVALTYRIATVLIAAIGVCYYLVRRRELVQAIDEVEHQGTFASAAELEVEEQPVER